MGVGRAAERRRVKWEDMRRLGAGRSGEKRIGKKVSDVTRFYGRVAGKLYEFKLLRSGSEPRVETLMD